MSEAPAGIAGVSELYGRLHEVAHRALVGQDRVFELLQRRAWIEPQLVAEDLRRLSVDL